MYIIMYNVIYERIELSGRGLWGLTAFVWTSGSKKPPPRVCHEKKKGSCRKFGWFQMLRLLRAVWKPAQKMPAAKVELRIWCQKECEFGEILMDEVPNSVESPDENPWKSLYEIYRKIHENVMSVLSSRLEELGTCGTCWQHKEAARQTQWQHNNNKASTFAVSQWLTTPRSTWTVCWKSILDKTSIHGVPDGMKRWCLQES